MIENMRKIFTLLVMLLSMINVVVYGTSIEKIKPDGSGTSQDPYKIGNVGNLFWYREEIRNGSSDICAILTDNIDLENNWFSITFPLKDYVGYFDGRGYKIYNFEYKSPLFAVIRDNVIVKNVKLEGNPSIISSDNTGSSILCWQNFGRIENCEVKIDLQKTLTTNSTERFGFICESNKLNGEIIGCKASGSLEMDATISTGGVVLAGICAVLESGFIKECSNCVNVKVNVIEQIESLDLIMNEILIGGIIGQVETAGKDYEQKIENCFNAGDLSILGNNVVLDRVAPSVGGIIGFANNYEKRSLMGCYNEGNITIRNCKVSDIYYEGEYLFPGSVSVSGIANNFNVFEGCYNKGQIILEHNEASLLRNGLLATFNDIQNFSEDLIKYNFYKEVGKVIYSIYIDEDNNEEEITDENRPYVITKITDDLLTSGEMAWALREYGYGLTLPNATNAYPTLRCFDKNLPAVYQLKLHQNETETIQYCNSENLNLPEVPENFGWFDSDGNEYFDDSQITEDLVLTVSEKKKYTVTAKVAEGCEDMGTVTGDGEYAKGDPVTITATPNEGYELDSWDVEGVAETTKEGNTIKFTMPANNVTVTATFTEKEDLTDPEEPVDPPVDPINYYNIYNETTYDFIDVSFSRNVVREGGSVNVYLGIPEGLDPAAVTLMFKRSLYGGWENLNTDDDGNYLINNIWTDIYVKAIVDESYIDPEPDENHIYIDLSETNDSIWLYTDHKLVEEGKTAVIQAEVAKSCQNKEIRYMYKRTVLGEWKEMPKDYSINQYVVRDITTDIYVKAYFVFDKQDPTTAKNPHHVYVDITATCEGLYLDATRHKVADEGDTKVFLYVKKGFETKDARYLFKRGLKGEWEDLVPGIEQNTFQVTDIEGDIYLKGIDAIYTGTEDIDGMVRVYTKDGSLFVYTAQPEEISVVSMTGVTVKRTQQTGLQSYPLSQGIYVICVGEQVFKVRVK